MKETCYYCGLKDKKVEAEGIWHCPNAHCSGPGGAWFRHTLDSFKECENGRHTVDEEEWRVKADAYMRKKNKLEIAKEAYRQIVEAIVGLEDSNQVYCDLPEFIEVDGERFNKRQLHIFSVQRDEHGKIRLSE